MSFQETIRARNKREALVGAITASAFALFAALLPGWEVKAGCVASALASGFVCWFILRVAAVRTDRPIRDEKLRQARLLDWVPTWYLAPPAITLLGLTIAMDRAFRTAGLDGAMGWYLYGTFLALCPVVILVNRMAAARLRAEAVDAEQA